MTLLRERVKHFGWHHVGRKSYGGKTILEEGGKGSDPTVHHRIATLEKCHYNFLVPLFRL